jgi:hypothetical protein
MIQKRVLAIAAVASMLATAAANAAVVYGNFSTPAYTYSNVSEDATAPDTAPLYQAPVTINNSLHFTPSAFTATSLNGGADLTNGTLSFNVNAKPGESIDRLAFQEFGDYILFGNGTSGTTASIVAAPVLITVNQVNGAAVTPFTLPFNLAFSPAGGNYVLPPGSLTSNGTFSGVLVADLTAALAAMGQTGQVTGAEVNLNNTLAAVSQPGTGAQIQKKVFTITPLEPGQPVPGPIVPEPASIAILGLVAPAMLLRRRSRNA